MKHLFKNWVTHERNFIELSPKNLENNFTSFTPRHIVAMFEFLIRILDLEKEKWLGY